MNINNYTKSIDFHLDNLTKSSNTETINISQSIITEEFSSNFLGILDLLITIAANEFQAHAKRKLCLVLIKNHLQSWDKIEKREYLRNRILSILGSNDFDIVKQASICIANIAKIEFLNGQWKEVFLTLLSSLENENLQYRKASLITLECLLQDIDLSSLNSEEVEQIYKVYFSSIDGLKNCNSVDEELLLYYSKVLSELIPFSHNAFKEEQKQVHIINTFFNFLDCDSIKVKYSSIHGLVNCFKYWYNYISQSILNNLMLHTVKIFSSNEKLVERLIELWIVIGEYEKKLCKIEDNKRGISIYTNEKNKSFCDKSCVTLANLLLNRIKIYPEPIEEEYWNLLKASSTLIIILSNCCSEKFVDICIDFVTDNYAKDDMILKKRSLLVFSSLLETSYKSKMCHLVKKYDSFFELLQVDFLRLVAADVIKRIFANYSEEFLGEERKNIVNRLLDYILYWIKDYSLAEKLCYSLNNFIKSFNKDTYNFCKFDSQKIDNLFKLSLALNFSQQEDPNCIPNSLANSISIVLANFCENASKENFALKYKLYELVIESLKKSLDSRIDNLNSIFLVQNNLLIILNSLIDSDQMAFTTEDYDLIFNIIFFVFKYQGTNNNEGLRIYESCLFTQFAKFEENWVNEKINIFWKPLFDSLENTVGNNNTSSALNCFACLFSCYKDISTPYSTDLFNKIINLLQV